MPDQAGLLRVIVPAVALCLGWLGTSGVVRAEPTTLTVRAVAGDGKFIGDAMGGVEIIVRDAATGELLAEGVTRGGAGDTQTLVTDPRERRTRLAGPQDAAFTTVLEIGRPRRIAIEARGPRFAAQAGTTASRTVWILPGRTPHGADGVVLELSGLAVQILRPAVYERGVEVGDSLQIEASVLLLCGCGLEPGGVWDADEYQIEYAVSRDGEGQASGALAYAGATSRFAATYRPATSGVYEIVVTAYNPVTGAVGVDHASVVVP